MLTDCLQSQDREARTKNGQIQAPKIAKYVHQKWTNTCTKNDQIGAPKMAINVQQK